MTEPVRVCMLVANDVSRDSRVQKAAWSAAEAGFEVLLLGYASPGSPHPPGESRLGAARLVRASRSDRWRNAAATLRAPWRDSPRRPPPAVLAGLLALRAAAAATTAGDRVRGRLVRIAGAPRTAGDGLRGAALRWAAAAYVGDGGWRRSQFHLRRLEEGWAPAVLDFAPDLIHAHDMHTPGMGIRLAGRLVRAGCRRPAVLYDAHEFVAGVDTTPLRAAAYRGLEGEFIRRADAVVTVSGQLARRLAERYDLRETPTVIANAPLLDAGVAGTAAPDLRRVAGVAAGVPLIVYSGALSPLRGLHTMIEALPQLPGVHAVIVCSGDGAHLAELLASAARLGVAGRVHRAGYVEPPLVPAYLAAADVGVIPILHTPNHELALITKYYEYMHARLPMAVSDVEAMAAATRALGCGEVFEAGSAPGLAAAVRRVLADPGRYRAPYTPELLAEHSWEAQARILCDTYARLAGRRPRPRDGRRRFHESPAADGSGADGRR